MSDEVNRLAALLEERLAHLGQAEPAPAPDAFPTPAAPAWKAEAEASAAPAASGGPLASVPAASQALLRV